jgi:hypothetical protein
MAKIRIQNTGGFEAPAHWEVMQMRSFCKEKNTRGHMLLLLGYGA